MTDRYIRNFLWYSVQAIILLVPLVFWHGVFFPYTFVKTIVFFVLTEFAFAALILHIMFQNGYKQFISMLSAAFVFFLAVMGIASFVGIDSAKSVWSDYERMFGVLTWLHMGAFFAVLVHAVREERDWQVFFKISIGVAALVAAVAVWQGLTTTDLSISTIGNAAYLSSYLVPVFFLVCMRLLREERLTRQVWLSGGILLLLVLAIIFTQARAGIVGLAAGGGVSIVLFLLLGDSQKRTFSLPNRFFKKGAVLLLAVGVAAGVFIIVFPERAKPLVPHSFGQLLDFRAGERTASGRLLVWQVAWEGWKERMLFGWGPENFSVLFNAHYVPELYFVEPWFDRAHSFLFDYGAVMGMAGLLAYSGMFGAAAYTALRRWKEGNLPFWSMTMLVALLAAHLAQNLFTFDTLSSSLVIISVFAYLASHKSVSLERRVAYAEHAPFPIRRLVAGCVGIAIVVYVGYGVAVKPFFANAAAYAGWELLRTGGGDEAAIAQFEKGISYGTRYSVDMRRFAAEYVFEFLKQGGKRPDVSLRRLMDYAVQKMDENIREEPEQVKWVMYRGELYSLMAQRFDVAFAQKAEEDFLQARDMSPGRPQIYLELANARKLQGDSAGAWKYIDHVTETIPNFLFGHLNAVVLAIETGAGEKEKQEVSALEKQNDLATEILRDAYVKKGRYADAAHIQELLISEYAEEPHERSYTTKRHALLYAQLAVLYQRAGEIEKARGSALMAYRLDPERRKEAESFLKTLP